MRILIADDSAVIRAQLQDILESDGWEVTACADGSEAWQQICSGKFRIALLDWMMPGKNGTEICQQLLADQQAHKVHVILVTGRTNTDDMATALASGASDYVTKPVCSTELLARLGAAKRIVDLQTQLAKSQKLESIGQLSAGIAHEINTPIQYICDNTHFFQDAFTELTEVLAAFQQLRTKLRNSDSYDADLASLDAVLEKADLDFLLEEVPVGLEHTLEGVNRVADIVRAMKNFAHPGEAERTATDLHKAIETTVMVARNEWKYVAKIATDFDSTLPPVPCYPGDLNQVLLNLIVNAAHAIHESVYGQGGGEGTITLRTKNEANRWAVVEVEDTGSGISETNLNRIFDPFFTTKEVGKGTGQGLAIAHSVIVDGHGGSIEVDSELNVGTTFRIRLPISVDPNCLESQCETENLVC